MPYVRNNIKVKVQQRSGFDKSHRNSGTLTCGTLTPLLCDEVIPNSRVSLKLNLAAQLPPLVSDTYMNCRLKVEAFYTPSRLLCKSFEDFFCDFPARVFGRGPSGGDIFREVKGAVPVIRVLPGVVANAPDFFAPGSLLDYLGVLGDPDESSGATFDINPLPILNYHLVWQEWYRNPRVQNPAFSRLLQSSQPTNVGAFMTDTYFHYGATPGLASEYLLQANVDDFDAGNPVSGIYPKFSLADGVSMLSLRQRNFGMDYFTGMRLDAQQGAPVSVSIDTGTDPGSMTISALRAANSLQQFRERNNLPSPRLVDQVKARYGANLSDGVAQRPICIGSATYDISSRGIDQTAAGDGGKNPFSGVAAQYGRAYGSGSEFIISDFTAQEPGYILVLVSLVPEVTYSTGIDRMFTRYLSEGSITDMACHLLQNVGDQPVFQRELSFDFTNNPTVIGYQDRYADFMYKPNRAHGEFRDGASLSAFVLQRSFDSESDPQMSSSFLEIPRDYMDQVFAVSVGISKVSAWYDCLLEYKVAMPLAEWSIPSLQDPAYEHGHTVSLRRNGQVF